MDIGIVEAVLRNIGAQAAQVADVLGPVGSDVAYALSGLAIVLLGMSFSFGAVLLVPVFELLMWSQVALWLCNNWSAAILWAVDSSREILGLFIPGYAGPTSLFGAAFDIAQRIWAEPEGWSFSINGTMGAMARHLVYGIAGYVVLLGLSVPALLSILAEITLLVAAALAPLTLGFLAFSVTRPIGWAGLTSLLNGVMRIVALGLVSVLFSDALAAVIDLPGPGEVLDMSALAGLVLLSLVAVIVGWSANGIAASLTGGGSLGLGAITAPFQAAGGVISSGAGMAGGGGAAAVAARAGGASGGGGGGGAGGGRSAGPVGSLSSGAFGS